MKLHSLFAVLAGTMLATPALAYIGPGAGVGAFATVIALIGAILLMIVGFVWYPVKRMLKGKSKPKTEADAKDTEE
ncbi:MAG: hypothetical protein HUJ27_01950 [Rhodobacteraceae bacterium]|nr:hypothetical protein [Paracoccaceae bacterium]